MQRFNVSGSVTQVYVNFCFNVYTVCRLRVKAEQVALLSQKGRAMLRVRQSLVSIVQYVKRNLLLSVILSR